MNIFRKFMNQADELNFLKTRTFRPDKPDWLYSTDAGDCRGRRSDSDWSGRYDQTSKNEVMRGRILEKNRQWYSGGGGTIRKLLLILPLCN
ncbi:hypothetical protein [Methanohalophilus mahii]|uniref:hypothetical protein n=1 Tax=Methanohalophilus mahii TaxID=2176 RepID=UPI00066469E9|nr:hypothetical protein [Methanohalophilus mahii]